VDAILKHVEEGNRGYLGALGWKGDTSREAIADALTASVRGDIPALGPRGGKRWPPRYFVRRAAWHILDHAWEIEDRSV
jgi:hypothetical protein